MFETLRQRLDWAARSLEMPAGAYEVLLEPSAAADLAISAYWFMTRRDADEGRSPYSRPGGGTLIGERLFGRCDAVFGSGCMPASRQRRFITASTRAALRRCSTTGSIIGRTEWVREGVLQNLITPRYWAAKIGASGAVPYINNLILEGRGPSMQRDDRADRSRALLVTCFWYIRTVDPQSALVTGLTRDGVFLVEGGRVKGAVNNFRWNMSPIAALAQATQIGAQQPGAPSRAR